MKFKCATNKLSRSLWTSSFTYKEFIAKNLLLHLYWHYFPRFYQERSEDAVDADTLIAVAQEQLRKASFEDFVQLREQCAHYDPTRYNRQFNTTN